MLVIPVLFITGIMQAQKFYFHLYAGMINYGGDLQNKVFTFNQANSALGAGISYAFLPHFSVSASFLSGKLSASDVKSNTENAKRNLSFYSKITEGSLIFQANLKNIPDEGRFTPYVFGGLTVFHFDPYAYDITGNKVFLKPLGTEGQGLAQYPDRKPYQLTQFALPFGVGMNYALSDNFMIGAEIGFRKLFTDYLDDASSLSYADTAVLRAARGDLAAKMSFRSDETVTPLVFSNKIKRGNPAKKDAYYTCLIKLYISLDGLFGSTGNSYTKKMRKQTGCPLKVL
jgi:hypothetical protein